MRFFIAGGTGFIGGHLVNALNKGGYASRCLVRTEERAAICRKAGFEAAIGDIADRESLKGKLDNCDIVVHLVGIIEEKGDMTFERVHVEGTKNLIDEAKEGKHKTYILSECTWCFHKLMGKVLQDKGRGRRYCKDMWHSLYYI